MTIAWPITGAGSQQLNLGAGGAFPTTINNLSKYAGPGPTVGARYLYGIDDYFGVGLQADYYTFASKDTPLDSPAGGQLDATFQDSAATLEILGRYTLIPEARLVPYLHSGVGLAYFRQKVDGTPLPGSAWSDTNTTEPRDIQDVRSLGVAFSFGVGVETNITDRLVMGLESAWHVFGVSRSTYGTGTLDVPTVLLRLGWRFGRSEPLQAGP